MKPKKIEECFKRILERGKGSILFVLSSILSLKVRIRRIGRVLKPYLDSFVDKLPLINTILIIILIILFLVLAYIERDFFVDLYYFFSEQEAYRIESENPEGDNWWRN